MKRGACVDVLKKLIPGVGDRLDMVTTIIFFYDFHRNTNRIKYGPCPLSGQGLILPDGQNFEPGVGGYPLYNRGRLTNTTNLILVVNTNATFVSNTNTHLVANTNNCQ